MMDPLAQVLSDLRLACGSFKRSDASAPWGIAFRVADGPSFHVIVSGRCCLRLDAERLPLAAGDLVLLPHGEDHQLADPPEGVATPLADLPYTTIGDSAALSRIGGGGEPALLICGNVRFSGPIANPVIDLLPRVLVIRREAHGSTHAWLETTLAMLGAEAMSLQPGAAAIMTRLTEILVLQTIRAWLERDLDEPRGWLTALRDPEIGQALALMHRQPEAPWTVVTLAREAHLSRSVFSQRFTRLVGVSPMQYLTRWRMQVASSWMREERLSASEAAYRLGYSSEAAFSRAFKRHVKAPPGAMRRRAATGPASPAT
jgi:AraC-like DNA-binding protein